VDLGDAEGFASTVRVIVALLEPLVAERVSHEALSERVHEVLEVMAKDPAEFAVAATETVVADRVREAAAPACVTVTV
jgi:hypothetical protein